MRAATPAVSAALVGLLALISVGAGTSAYRTGPPTGHTGAFGEPDCAACHFDAVRDDPRGAATIDAPEAYRPGERHDVTVTIRHPELAAAGFQLTARFTDGDPAGRQAGVLEPAGPETRAQEGGNGVVYVSHSAAGVAPDTAAGAGGVRRWTVRWTAPESGGSVAFDLAANAANDDDSEFGDRIYRARRTGHPAHAGAAAAVRR